MSKSKYIYDNGLGCGCSGSKPTPGLGESPVENQVNTSAIETKKDLVKTAKDYINVEIPFKYKAGALAIGVGYCWWKSRGRRKR
jgi:hypothetical protein